MEYLANCKAAWFMIRSRFEDSGEDKGRASRGLFYFLIRVP